MTPAFDMMRAFEDAAARQGDSRGLNSDIPRKKARHEFLGQFRRVVERADHGVFFEAPNQAFRLAVAVAVLASSLSGTIAVAQQIAVNVEGQAAQEASPDEEQPDDAYAGARALYLGHSVFRIHGTNQPETIGHAVSSGCFRLDNGDVIDLYDRVQVGAKVLVRQSAHVS